jgi:hypothetical protein
MVFLFVNVDDQQLTLACGCGEQQVRHKSLPLSREPPVRTSLMDSTIMARARWPVIS